MVSEGLGCVEARLRPVHGSQGALELRECTRTDNRRRDCRIVQEPCQTRYGRRLGALVTEGRDQGTVVFPDTPWKFYLDATAECRARRRYLQLRQKDDSADYQQVLAAQKQRDHRDSNRDVAPLKPHADAIIIDTTEMTIDDVIDAIYNYVREDYK